MLVFLVIALTATATLCISFLFILGILALSYAYTRSYHKALVEKGQAVSRGSAPAISSLVEEAVARLRPDPVEVFVAPGEVMNAYSFGLSSPKVIVLQAPLLQRMNGDELLFVVGHELGHVRLGHTWLNSLVGGLAGIPSPFLAAALLRFAFLWWNRACEFSADRAGLLVCGDPNVAISALIKLTAGTEARSRIDLERALQRIEAEDDHVLSGLAEALATHPMTVRRIEELRRYAGSEEYRRLRQGMDRNVPSVG